MNFLANPLCVCVCVCVCVRACTRARVHAHAFNHIWFFVTPWAIDPRLLCPWDFPGKNIKHWLPFPTPGDLPNPGIEPTSLVSPALAGRLPTTMPPGKPNCRGPASLSRIQGVPLG